MPKVHFIADYDFRPAQYGGRVTIAYKAGMHETVTRECAEGAIAAGKANGLKTDKGRFRHDTQAERR